MDNEQQTPDSILDNDMTDVSPDAPIIPKNSYVLEVVKVEQKHSDKKDTNYLNVQLRSVVPITAVNSEIVPAGSFTTFGIIGMTPSERYTAEAVSRNVKKFMVCFGQPSGKVNPLDQWTGKRGHVTVGFSKKTDDYPDDRNEVKSFDAPGK